MWGGSRTLGAGSWQRRADHDQLVAQNAKGAARAFAPAGTSAASPLGSE